MNSTREPLRHSRVINQRRLHSFRRRHRKNARKHPGHHPTQYIPAWRQCPGVRVLESILHAVEGQEAYSILADATDDECATAFVEGARAFDAVDGGDEEEGVAGWFDARGGVQLNAGLGEFEGVGYCGFDAACYAA